MTTEPTDPDGGTGDESETYTPGQVREQARSLLAGETGDDVEIATENVFTSLLTPESRLRIIAALVSAGGEPLSVSRLCEMSGVSQPTFHRQESALTSLGVMVEAEKVGNARRFALNTDHPVAQVLVMLDNVLTFGETDITLDERFIGDGDGVQK